MTRSSSVSPAIQKIIDKILDDNHVDKTKVQRIVQDTQTCAADVVDGAPGAGGLLGGLIDLLSGLLG